MKTYLKDLTPEEFIDKQKARSKISNSEQRYYIEEVGKYDNT